MLELVILGGVFHSATSALSPWPMYGQSLAHSRQQPEAPALPTGAKGWGTQLGAWVYGAPCVGPDEAVYLTTWAGEVVALEPGTGSVRWRFKAFEPPKPVPTPAPVPAGRPWRGCGPEHVGTERCPIWGSPALLPGPDNGTVTVVIAADNVLLAITWTAPGPASLRWSSGIFGAVLASPTVDQVTGTTYIGCLGGTMGAFDAWGKNLWFAPGGSGPIYSSAAVTDSAVYFGTMEGNVIALNRLTGARLWVRSLGLANLITSSPSVSADGATLFIASNGAGYLWAFPTALPNATAPAAVGSETATPSTPSTPPDPIWSHKVGTVDGSSPAVAADGTVYIGSLNGSLYAFRGSDGAAVWSLAVPLPIQSSPALGHNGQIFFCSQSTMYSVTPRGNTTWSAKLPGNSTFSSPALGRRGLYIGDNSGTVTAFTG